MLAGSYPMSVDAKARVTLPAVFRKQLVDGDNHFDPRSRDDVRLRTGLWARAVEVDIDSAGRVALGKLDVAKPGMREKLGLTAAVTVVGAGDHFEVWNTETWAATQESLEDDLDALLFHD